jgi:hypothetical protein
LLRLYRRKPFHPFAKIMCEDQRPAPAFDGSQFARFDRLIKCCPSGASDNARLSDGVSQWFIHVFAPLEAGMVPATVPASSRALANSVTDASGCLAKTFW